MKKELSGCVILTYGRSLMALTAAKSLAERGIKVIGCDDVDMTVLSFSKHVSDYFVHPPYEDDLHGYLESLKENIKKFKPDEDTPYVLMPMFRDAKILAKHKEYFGDDIIVATPDIDTISKVNPKDIFAQTCKEIGLPIPGTWQPQNIEKLKNISDIDYPCLIKPIDQVGGRGICKVDNQSDLEQLFEESTQQYESPPLIQEMIEGEDYCFAALCDQGKIVAHMAYKNLHQFPRDSGAGIMRETIDDTPFLKSAEKLLSTLKWNGVAQIDFRWSGKSTDKAYLIEVNPRFWAGLFHSVESGVDFPWLLYQLTAHGSVEDASQIKIGTKTKVPGLWTLSAIQEIVEDETHFYKLKTMWEETWNKNNDAEWKEKFQKLGRILKETIDAQDIMDRLKEMHKDSGNAKNEVSIKEDPFANLGILFIASSLLRHGKLPPEIKS